MSQLLASARIAAATNRAAIMLAGAFLGAVLASSPSDAEPKYADQGAQACLDCHETEYVLGIAKTSHANREDPDAPAAQKACESCHGASATHSQFPMQVENLHFSGKSAAEAKVQNQACLECHADGEREHWDGSAHGFEDVVCSRCHSIHDPAKIVPAEATVVSGCTASGCHDTLMADASPASFSHAVDRKIGDDGQMTCAGCHNPHGPLSSGRCVDCHAQTPEVLSRESEKARRFHEVATRKGTDCIRCHKALAHPIGPLQLQEQNETIERLAPPMATGSGG